MALAAVQRPSRWLSRLAGPHSDEVSRRWLILRSYLNPAGSVEDPRSNGSRLHFSTFRPRFTEAGFEVVDCPSLTRGSKNGADIRIAIDVMTALRAPVHYDEFVIASSDADFTPLLHVVRAEDRRATVIATGCTSAAYEALADRYLGGRDVVALMAEADAPLNLSRLASRVAEHVGPEARSTHWFGAGAFRKAVARIDLPGAQFSPNHLWDPARHQPPEEMVPG